MRHSIKICLSILAICFASCKTMETGGKVVDRNRGEIIIGSAGGQVSALPDGKDDASLTKTRVKIEEALAKKSTDIPNLLNLAQLQLAQDRFQDSEETCQKVLRIDLKNEEAKKLLALLAIRQNNPDLALIFVTALGGEQSRDSGVINILALVSNARNNSSESMRLWKHALTLNANDISVRMNLGVMYLKYRMLGQASAQFERVLKVAPHHQDAKLHLAIIDGSKGQHDKSMAVYNELLKQDKHNTMALFNLAVSEKALAKYDDALETLKTYLKASPGKSAQTDKAFAMVEEINTLKKTQGEPVNDSDIQALAATLDNKKAPSKADLSQTKTKTPPAVQTGQSNQVQSSKAEAAKKSDLGEDKDIDDLEKELRAH